MNSDKLIINLPDVEATLKLGSTLASFFLETKKLVPIFLNGDLGAGKTTFVRALVESFPGAQNAEVRVPVLIFLIFTLQNLRLRILTCIDWKVRHLMMISLIY